MIMTREERLARLLAPSTPSQSAQSVRSASVDEGHRPPKEPTGRFYGPTESDELKKALTPLDEVVVGVLETKMVKGFAHEGDDSPQVILNRLSDGIATVWGDDHHFQPLWSPKLTERLDGARRLTKAVFDVEEVQVDCLIWDWDTPDHVEWTDAQFKEAVLKAVQHPMLQGAVFYRTRGGLRAIRPLAKPFIVRGEGGADWSAFYERVFGTLPTIEGQAFDPACADAPRLFRAPWVKRRTSVNNPRKVLQTGLVYVPDDIEAYELCYADHKVITDALVPKIRKNDSIKGLVNVYRDLGWLGKESGVHNGHPKYHAKCPWSELHSGGGDGSDDSCALLADDEGGYVVHCLHGSCRSNHKNGGVVRYLQQKHSDVWRAHCSVEQSQTLFDPFDYTSFLDNAVDVLHRAYKGEVFQRHQMIVSLEQSPTGEALWHEWTADYLTGVLNRSTRWMQEHTDKEGQTSLRRCVVPKTIVLQSMDEIRTRLPHVVGRTVLPIIDPVTMQPTRLERGYCKDTKTYFLPSPSLDLDELARVAKSKPTLDDAISAVTEILDLYDDFPWQEKAHKLIAVACTMTAALRRSIDGPAPLFLINANSKGVGKTKLISAVVASIYGHSPVLSATPERPEELNKMLSSILLCDNDYLVLDNVRGGIGDAQFDAFITSDSKQDRILGKSQMFTAKQRVFLGATGNNASLRGDTDRRTIVARLVTEMENPEERKGFRHHDLIATARERVTETWCAVLTILRAFHLNTTAAERAQINREARSFGSFELWLDWVRDPLYWLGKEMYPDAESVDVVQISSKEVEEARADSTGDFFSQLIEWQEHVDLKNRDTECEWTPSELGRALAGAKEDGLDNFLAEMAGSFKSFSSRYIGAKLSAYRDKVSQGYTLTSRRIAKGTVYVLKATHKAPEPPTPEPPKPTSTKSEPTKSEPTKSEPTKSEPTKSEPTKSEPTKSEPTKSEPTKSELEWKACDVAEEIAVDERTPARFSVLRNRCALYADGMCRKENIECEYPDASGKLTEAEARVLRKGHDEALVQIESPKPKTEQPKLDLPEGESPVLAVIKAELLVGSKRGEIVEALIERDIAPPTGKRKWTVPTVSAIIKKHGLKKPKAEKPKRDRVQETVDKVGGTWDGYWPSAHPIKHVHLLDAPPLDESRPSAHVTCNPTSLLTALVGYVITPERALAERPKRDEEDK